MESSNNQTQPQEKKSLTSQAGDAASSAGSWFTGIFASDKPAAPAAAPAAAPSSVGGRRKKRTRKGGIFQAGGKRKAKKSKKIRKAKKSKKARKSKKRSGRSKRAGAPFVM
jgi:hypothetical protein